MERSSRVGREQTERGQAVTTPTLQRECGWCGLDLGSVPCAPGCDGVSHGICDECLNGLFLTDEEEAA